MSPDPSFCYVIPVRIESAPRLRNLSIVLSWLSRFASVQPILVEQDTVRHVDEARLPRSTIYRFDHSTDAFNKGRAMNLGFSMAERPVVVFGDGDVVMDPVLISRAVAACEHGMDAVDPYRRLVDLDEERTAVLDSIRLPKTDEDSIAGVNRLAYGENLCFAGGVFAIRRDFYERIGGMDEEFSGWGGEDDAMSAKILRLTDRCVVAREGTAFHLWHPRARPDKNDPAYRDNLSRAASYRSISDEELRIRCARQREKLALHNVDRFGS